MTRSEMLYAIGDALGLPYESYQLYSTTDKIKEVYSNNYTEVVRIDRFRGGYITLGTAIYSDDYAMYLALKKALKNKDNFEDEVIEQYIKFAQGDRKRFMGRMTRNIFANIKTIKGVHARLDKFSTELTNNMSNGPLMRAAACIYTKPFPKKQLMYDVSLTCNNELSTVVTLIYAKIIHSLYHSEDYPNPIALIQRYTTNKKIIKVVTDCIVTAMTDAGKRELPNSYHGKDRGYIMYAFYYAMYAFYLDIDIKPSKLLKSIIIAGGDTDTNAAIAAAIYGARLDKYDISKYDDYITEMYECIS